jgi:hypothetical protein
LTATLTSAWAAWATHAHAGWHCFAFFFAELAVFVGVVFFEHFLLTGFACGFGFGFVEFAILVGVKLFEVGLAAFFHLGLHVGLHGGALVVGQFAVAVFVELFEQFGRDLALATGWALAFWLRSVLCEGRDAEHGAEGD